jgi:hypothetical protein
MYEDATESYVLGYHKKYFLDQTVILTSQLTTIRALQNPEFSSFSRNNVERIALIHQQDVDMSSRSDTGWDQG